MMNLTQHRAGITSSIIAHFSDDSAPQLGLSAWFPSLTTSNKSIGIEVERNRQLVAVDVQRNAGGNVNTFSHSAEKLYTPPFFEEIYDFTQTQYYDITFGEVNNPTKSQAEGMIVGATKRLNTLKYKIQRAIEKQRAQVLQTGIVTLKNGDNIDYKRKSESISVLDGDKKWSSAKSDPLKTLEDGINFIRKEGKSASRSFDLIMGANVLSAIMNNPSIKEKADIRRFNVLEIGTKKFDNKTGLNFQGRLSTSNGNIDLWTYDDHYENSDGTFSEYINADTVVLLPRDLIAKTAYAGVPAIMRDKNNAESSKFIKQVEAEFYMDNFLDEKKFAHWFRIYSAPLVVPVSIDRIWSAKVI